MAKHRPHVTNEARELPPVDGYRRFEPTGRACMVCPCGTVTGFVPAAEAVAEAEDHWARAEEPA